MIKPINPQEQTRLQRIYALRMSGKKFYEIAKEIGVCRARAHELFKKAKRHRMQKQINLEREFIAAHGTIEEIAREFIREIKKIRRVNRLYGKNMDGSAIKNSAIKNIDGSDCDCLCCAMRKEK